MSEATPDPYQSPGYFAERLDPQEMVVRRRPGGLTAICVIAIILGGLGVVTAVVGVVFAAAGQAIQKAAAPQLPGELEGEALQVQAEMNQAIQAVGQRYLMANVALALLSLALAIGLIVGRAQSLKIKPLGRTVLLAVFAVAILFELARGSFQIYQQMQMFGVMQEYWPRLMKSAAEKSQQPMGGPNFETMMNIAFTVAKISAYAIVIVPALVKGAFYFIGAIYLARPKLKELFERSAAAQPSFGSAAAKV